MGYSIFNPVNPAARSFRDFLLQERPNKRLLLITASVVTAQFILFKVLYPFPDFFDDSYSYLYAAYAHLDISVWPIGYSKFLGLFHKITYSDTALVAFQYFFLQAGCLYLYFTLRYFFHTSRWTNMLLWVFMFINPLSLYICNLVNSDALFAALTIIWLTQLIWVVYRPAFYQLLIQAVLLFFCFTVRNNAYFYPLVTIAGILLSKYNWKVRVLGMLMPFLLVIPFILHSREAAYRMTGTRQFSLFSGWQLANNALYTYDQIEVDSTTLPTAEARELNRMAISFFKKTRPGTYRDDLESFVGNFFIKFSAAPLKTYYRKHFHSKTEMGEIVDWGKASAAFEPFGKTIVLHHPVAYVRYFMWPNFWHYLLPPLSNLEVYDYGSDEIDPVAKEWFHYSSNKIHCISNSLQGSILLVYTAVFLLCNVFLAWKIIRYSFYWYLGEPREKIPPVFLVTAAFVLLNFGFTLAATVNIMRYQVAPMIIIPALGLLIGEYQFQPARKAKQAGVLDTLKPVG